METVLFRLFILSICVVIYIVDGKQQQGIAVNKKIVTDAPKKLVCYYALPDDPFSTPLPPGLNSTLCTHIIYIPTIIRDCEIVPRLAIDVVLFNKTIPVLKKQNPSLKILISNGGGNDNSFTPVLQSASNRTKFVKSVIPFLKMYGFDGIDLDWEFPGWNGLPKAQIHNFSLTFAELQNAFVEESKATGKEKFLLSMAVSGSIFLMLEIYEYDYIRKYMDFVNIMGYDYNGYTTLKPLTGHNSPLFHEKIDILFFNNLNWSSVEWAKKVPKEKINVGVPTYIKTFNLTYGWWHGIDAPCSAAGLCNGGSYNCVCDARKKYNATRVFDDAAKVPYLYYNNQWLSYDDEQSLSFKTKWAMQEGFGGMMVYEMRNDDYEGYCDGKTKFPLISAIRKTMF